MVLAIMVYAARVPGSASLVVEGGSIIPVTVHLSPQPLLLGKDAPPHPIRNSTYLLSLVDISTPAPGVQSHTARHVPALPLR